MSNTVLTSIERQMRFWPAVHFERGLQMFRAFYSSRGVSTASQRPYCVVYKSASVGHSWFWSKNCMYVCEECLPLFWCHRMEESCAWRSSELYEDIFVLQLNSAVLVVLLITQPLDSHSAILSVIFALQSNKTNLLIDREVLRKWFVHSVTGK